MVGVSYKPRVRRLSRRLICPADSLTLSPTASAFARLALEPQTMLTLCWVLVPLDLFIFQNVCSCGARINPALLRRLDNVSQPACPVIQQVNLLLHTRLRKIGPGGTVLLRLTLDGFRVGSLVLPTA